MAICKSKCVSVYLFQYIIFTKGNNKNEENTHTHTHSFPIIMRAISKHNLWTWTGRNSKQNCWTTAIYAEHIHTHSLSKENEWSIFPSEVQVDSLRIHGNMRMQNICAFWQC